MSYVIVDTNVLMVANEDGPPEQADTDCVTACIERLQAIQSGESGECLVLDEDDYLMSEYESTLRSSPQPSVGHAFLQWLYQVSWHPDHCERVKIHCLDEDDQIFAEFPDHDALREFDVSDRKFVATANAHIARPPILQAVDAKWMGWEPALAECGLRIEWICRENAERLYAEHKQSSK